MKMFIVQKMFLVMVPLSTLFTSVAMLLPYWWSSETFQIGLWRARSIPTSSWILVEPQIETTEGRLLLILQLLSFLSVLLADLHGVLWFIIVLRYRHSTASFPLLLSLLVVTVFAYLTLSMMIYLVWQTSKDYVHLIHISYSFYLVLAIVFSHSLTLISLTINLAQYRTSHRSIQPYGKVLLAFNQPIASATP